MGGQMAVVNGMNGYALRNNIMVSTLQKLNRLNREEHFSNPFPTKEDRTDQGYLFTLGVDYRPAKTGPTK